MCNEFGIGADENLEHDTVDKHTIRKVDVVV